MEAVNKVHISYVLVHLLEVIGIKMTITTLIVANILHKNTPVIQYEHPCIDILNNRYVSSTYNFVWKGTSYAIARICNRRRQIKLTD